MRILILTHPRSGGFSLLNWISSELDYKSYHEPLLDGPDCKDFLEALSNPNVVVKEDVSHILSNLLVVSDLIRKFDKIIFHTRDNLRDCAISRVRQVETGESHVVYDIDAAWLAANENNITRTKMESIGIHGVILSAGDRHKEIGITTSYEGVYSSGDDIQRICQFLEIADPQWLDVIDPKRRLRGGDTNLKDPTKKMVIIEDADLKDPAKKIKLI
jgi:hypothetical protein